MIVLWSGIICFPVLLVLVLLERSLDKSYSESEKTVQLTRRAEIIARAIGALLSTACAISSAFLIQNNSFERLFFGLLATLCVPFVVGFALLASVKNMSSANVSERQKVILNEMAIGALHGVWLVPVSAFVVGFLVFNYAMYLDSVRLKRH